ncbi:hypothetical protein [Priestia endophytica]|uniref:Uncharacterized protein n=1 Tax=Priestia endophytica DSM 13796 TaxID=1121089 RepID=A0A1I6C0M5_9BACI|nr:hypothetical protein [Priestia endophytica]SFQ86704.1 hypothetical protein SAMN02745910_04704 [Priestia endophytica DSM 13796]
MENNKVKETGFFVDTAKSLSESEINKLLGQNSVLGESLKSTKKNLAKEGRV